MSNTPKSTSSPPTPTPLGGQVSPKKKSSPALTASTKFFGKESPKQTLNKRVQSRSEMSSMSSTDDGKKQATGAYYGEHVEEPEGSSDESDHEQFDSLSEMQPSRPSSKEDILERKPTLEPEFIKMLTVPDTVEESNSLFETNNTSSTQLSRGSFSRPRKTGFETWLKSTISTKILNDNEVESKVLLVYKNLNFEVLPDRSCIPLWFRMKFQNFSSECLNLGVDESIEGFPVLRGISGVMEAGKTCLILGPIGSGTTSLLRALSGRLNSGENVTLDVCKSRSGDINLKSPDVRRTSVFVSTDDRAHFPVMTVRETMDFAARCCMKSDGSIEMENTIKELVDRVVESLGLSEQSNTVVGGDELRGISGGQKRRCTLGEMLFSKEAKLLFLDDISNGLDASKAQQVVRIVRSACRVLGFSAYVSLLQPNDMLFDAFDNVLVLSESGEMVFSGPTNESISYFETQLEQVIEAPNDWARPSGMSSAEYILMAVTKLTEYLASHPNLKSLSTRYLESRDGIELLQKLEQAEKELEVQNTKTPLILSPYPNSNLHQLKILIHRKFVLISRNPVTLGRILIAIAFGIVVGTLFSNLNQDAISALGRSGFMFLSIFLVFMLATAVTVPDNFAMRLVFYKHHGAKFHNIVTFYVANLLCDLPLAITEAFLLSIIPYFWAGMRSNDASGFFYFFAILLAMEFVGQASSRLISALTPTAVLGQLFSSGYILFCGLLAGYMPSYAKIPPWWRWLNWLTPVSYAYEGLILNQFACCGVGNASYPLLTVTANGTTLNLGSQSGYDQATSLGSPRIPFNQATAGLSTPGQVMAFDFGMLLIFSLILDISAVLVLRKSHDWYEPSTRRSILKVKSRSSKAPEYFSVMESISNHFRALKNEEFDKSDPAASQQKLADPALEGKVASGQTEALLEKDISTDSISIALVDISYYVPIKAKKEEIEHGIDTTDEKKSSSKKIWNLCQFKQFEYNSKPSEDTFFSFNRIYSMILFKLNCCGRKDSPMPEPGKNDEQQAASDVLPPEERIQLNVHRPRSGSKRGRAWSNKVPLGEEEAEAGVPQGELRLLTSVNAIFRSGEMTALMGESGCGKTTLMDVVASYKTGGRIKGQVLLNGVPIDKQTWRRISGYAEQNDLHIPTLSVYESLIFAARCRCPKSMSTADIETRVESLLNMLELETYRNWIVGEEDAGEGLSKDARKRVTIGVELVSYPRVLFLDEPTTGLDSMGAEIVIEAIRKATTKMNICTVATIHQPSRAVFGRFDRLLLLQKGGIVLYHGAVSSFSPFQGVIAVSKKPSQTLKLDEKEEESMNWQSVHVVQRQPSGLQSIQENAPEILVADMRPAPTIADKVLAYFARLGAPPLKQGFNPADHLLIAVETLLDNGVDVADVFEESQEYRELMIEIGEATKSSLPQPQIAETASFGTQLSLLIERNIIIQWRDPRFCFFRILWYAVTAFVIGTVFILLGCSITDAVFRIAALFFCVYAAIIPMQVAVVPYVKERAIIYREVKSGTYSAWADGISRFFADLPFHALFAIIFYAIVYYAVGFQQSPEQTGYFILMIFLGFWLLTSFGQMVASLSPNIETANGLAGLVILLSTFLMGFLIPIRFMPQGWRWAIWVNMLYYILQGLCVNELGGEYFQLPISNSSALAPCSTTFPSLQNYSLVNITSSLRPPPFQPGCVEEVQNLRKQLPPLIECNFRECEDPRFGILSCLILNCGDQLSDAFSAVNETLSCLPPNVVSNIVPFLNCWSNTNSTEEKIACVWNNLIPEDAQKFLIRFSDIIRYFLKIYRNNPKLLEWFLAVVSYKVIFIPGDLILYFFEWAMLVPGEGFVANTQWFYCIFAVGMFLIAWELIKLFARVYVIWIVR